MEVSKNGSLGLAVACCLFRQRHLLAHDDGVSRELPTGTELGNGYAEALGEHRRILRETFSAHDGAEVDMQGDAFFVAFPTAPSALEAAAQAVEKSSSGPIRVRIGIHTGTPQVSEQ